MKTINCWENKEFIGDLKYWAITLKKGRKYFWLEVKGGPKTIFGVNSGDVITTGIWDIRITEDESKRIKTAEEAYSFAYDFVDFVDNPNNHTDRYFKVK